MPHIPTLPPDQAEPEVKAVYENFCARMQFPAPQNFILTQGPSPQIVRATWDLVRQVLVEGEIPRWHKEPASSHIQGSELPILLGGTPCPLPDAWGER